MTAMNAYNIQGSEYFFIGIALVYIYIYSACGWEAKILYKPCKINV